MDIYEFLPKYPNITKAEEENLNPYDEEFYESIFKKREFYDERFPKEYGPEDVKPPDEKGVLMKHQKIIARFLSSNTMYDSLLLVHEMGCVVPETPILLWSGSVKRADEILVGDELIGDDGKLRKVLEIVGGESEMFEIKQHKADTYIVNGSHVLTLQICGNMKIMWTEKTQEWSLRWFDKKLLKPKAKTICCKDVSKQDGYLLLTKFRDEIMEDNIFEITVRDYLKLSKTEKSYLKGYKCEGVKWPSQNVKLDPYILGMCIGDGFTSSDEQLIDYWKTLIKKSGDKCGLLEFKSMLRKYDLINNKHIPIEYIVNDKKTRLELLAGIIDTDGHVYSDGICVDISRKTKILSNQICYLARSLGLSCQQKQRGKSCLYKNNEILNIRGNGIKEIPAKIIRKSLKCRLQCFSEQIKNSLVTQIDDVCSIGIGRYVGWKIGDNKRFLLGDFTVTHNTGKTCSAIGAIEQIKNEDNNFKGALIFAKGQGLLQNFVKELRDKCTAGQYVPEGFVEDSALQLKKFGGLTELETTIRTKKLIETFYSTGTFETFAKHLHKLSDEDIISLYSNHVIVLDEVHNLRIQDVTEGDRISMYVEFKRFLHLVKNCKIMLLSGTPMKDTPEEIASVMNLILPEKMQLPVGEKFVSKYLDKHGENIFTVKKNKVKTLKKRFKGRVSFLKAIQSTVTKEFIGEKNVGKLQHFIVEPLKMSKFQTKAYTEAVKLDEKGNSGVHYNARQASLMVYPDGSYGQPRLSSGKIDKMKGFDKYVKTKTTTRTFIASQLTGKNTKSVTQSYSLTPELISAIEGDTKKYNIKNLKFTSSTYIEVIQKRLENLREYSVKYANVIESMLNARGQSCFVYSELVTGSGSIVFAELLKIFGFSPATGKESTHGLRYGFLTSDTTSTQIHKLINCFNQPANMHGDIIKVLIGSRVVSEGVSFSNIQREYILTPWYNYSETDQAIARGYRLGSHKALLNAGEVPVVRISQLVAMPRKGKVLSIDLYMYEISEDKDITIRGILRYMMEAGFDCSLNYYRNHVTGEDGKRGCEYQDCKYSCDGINMKNIKDGLSVDEIDESTYQLYYTDPKILPIRKDLEKYFIQNNELSLDNVIRYFDGKYTEQEINNALKTIIQKSEEDMYYKDYVQIYSISNVKQLMNGISILFSTNFRMSFDDIKNKFPTYTHFEILTALKNMIDKSVVIKNKYGFTSYLREDQNIYFIVNNLSVTDDSFSDYYSRVPNIVNHKLFTDVLYDVQIENLPTFIKILCQITKQDTFSKLIKVIPVKVQEMFIEAAIEAHYKDIAENQVTRKLVLDYFINYIHEIKDVWVSNRLNDEDDEDFDQILRCYQDGKWNECGPEYEGLIEEKQQNRKQKLEENPWGYYGQFNPETGIFSIVNVLAQKDKQKEVKEEKRKELAGYVEKGKMTQKEMDEELESFVAGREIYPGRNCKQGWNVFLLMRIVIRNLKLDFPNNFKKNDKKSHLRKLLKENKYLGKGSRKDAPIYTTEEINALSKEELKRALYWSIRKTGGFVTVLCDSIQQWFRKTKWQGLDMLVPDKQAGTSGGHKKIAIKLKQAKKMALHIDKIVPVDKPEKFKEYLKDIQKLMTECFAVKKYIPDIDDKKWVIVFSGQKLVGFLTIDNKNVIWNVCIATNYRRRGIAQQAIQIAVEDACPLVSPKLLVDNKGKEYKKLYKLYMSYGFTLVKNDGKITTMEFKCT
jgi:hypothetical protein